MVIVFFMMFLVFVVFGLVCLNRVRNWDGDFDGYFDWIRDRLVHWIWNFLLDRIWDTLHHGYGVRTFDWNLNGVVDWLLDRVWYDLLDRHVNWVWAVDRNFDWNVHLFLDRVRYLFFDVNRVRFIYVHGVWAINGYFVGYVNFLDHGVWMGHWNFDGVRFLDVDRVRFWYFHGVRLVDWNGHLDGVWIRFCYFHGVRLWNIFGYGLDGYVVLV